MSSVPLLPDTSDERLLELIGEGEERAFEVVVVRYRSSLVGYCRRLGLSESRADDAVQQCLLSALLALRRGDSVRDLRAWLGRIAHNVAVNMLRSGAASRETVLGDERGVEERAIHIPDLDGGIAAREALAEVAALPPMQREALLQSALGGRSYGEVAASMGLSEGAVRGLLHRARLSLRNAAAVFSPLPAMRRVAGWLGAGGPSAGRVLELSTPGAPSGMSATAVRAIGAGLTAVILAAGVAVAPLRVGSHPHPRALADAHRAASPVASAAQLDGAGPAASPAGPITGRRNTVAPLSAASKDHASAGGPGTGLGLLHSPASTPAHRREPATSSPGSQPQVPAPTTASAPAQASSVTGTVGQPAAPPAEQPPAEAKKAEPEEKPGSDDGSEHESETGEHEQSDNERTEEAEREHAEEAREREAEEAVEHREREAAKNGNGDS